MTNGQKAGRLRGLKVKMKLKQDKAKTVNINKIKQKRNIRGIKGDIP